MSAILIRLGRFAGLFFIWWLVTVSFLPLAPVQAADGVSINVQIVNCAAISVNYTVTGGSASETAELWAYTTNDVLVGYATGLGTSGQHAVTIFLSSTQPVGTALYVYIQVGLTSASSLPQPCGGGGIAAPPPWQGFVDDRLNPAPDEYYSIWCKANQVEIWRSIPDSATYTVPLSRVVNLADGGSLDAGNGMTITRSGDTITVYGSNGNLTPAAGSKSFSLSECLSRNGGPPPAPPIIEDTENAPPPPPSQSVLEYCVQTYPQDTASFVACMFVGFGGLRSGEGLFWWLLQICGPVPLMVWGPAGWWAWRQRRAGFAAKPGASSAVET
jgi:hypothetical protein